MPRSGGDGFYTTLTVTKKLTLTAPLKADVVGRLVGDVTGNVRGCLTGSIIGDVKGDLVDCKKLKCIDIQDDGSGHGIHIEQIHLQKGTMNTERVDIDRFLQVDTILEHSDNNGVKIDGVLCQDQNIIAQNVIAHGSMIGNTIKSNNGLGITIEGAKISNGVVDGVEYASKRGKSNGYCELDANAKIPINRLNAFPFTLRGVWDAASNSPSLNSQHGVAEGDCFMVVKSGNAMLGKISEWTQGDLAVFAQNQWHRVRMPNIISSVNGKVGSINLKLNDLRITEKSGDILVDNGNEVQRLEKGNEDGQVLMVDKSKSLGISWNKLSRGFTADLHQHVGLFNNIPMQIAGWVVDLECGGFNDNQQFNVEKGCFNVPNDGRYEIICTISYECAKHNQTTKLDLIKNNTTILAQDIVRTPESNGNGYEFLKIHTVRMLKENDILILTILQTNQGGENVLLGGTTYKSAWSVVRIS